MNQETKEKIVNVEDLQAAIRQTFNIGFGNSGTCSTAAATAAKAVTLGTTFSMTTNATILVTFTNGISVANSTLAVTHTDLSGTTTTETAKPIYLKGAALEPGLVKAGDSLLLRYNGTQWDVVGTLDQDLSNYYTKSEIDGMIGNIETLLASI